MKMFQRTTASNNLCRRRRRDCAARRRAAHRHRIPAVLSERASRAAHGRPRPDHLGADARQARRAPAQRQGRGVPAPSYGDSGRRRATTPTRDILTYAIYKEVEAGRGSPHGGVYLSFQHIPATRMLKRARPRDRTFSSATTSTSPSSRSRCSRSRIIRWAASRWTSTWRSCVPGLYAAGEIVGGANGANRLSGNALPEALVFGAARRRGRRQVCGEEAVAALGRPHWPQRCARRHPAASRHAARRRVARQAT